MNVENMTYNNLLQVLDLLVKKSNKNFLISVCRKPIFTKQHMRWDLFGPKRGKTNLIGTLVPKTLEICTPEKLFSEVCKTKNILQQNGYRERIIISGTKKKISNFQTFKQFWARKVPGISKIILTLYENQYF